MLYTHAYMVKIEKSNVKVENFKPVVIKIHVLNFHYNGCQIITGLHSIFKSYYDCVDNRI